MWYVSSDEDLKFWDFLRMHRSDDCRSWNFITNINNWAHVSFWFWKNLNFLHFLPCKEIISCDEDLKFWDFLVLFRFPQMGSRVIHYYRFQCFCPVFRINWLSQNERGGGGGSLAVFVNKINNLATRSWKKIQAFAP
jgi:hypothetical protein